MPANPEWAKVFSAAVKKAKAIREAKPKLTVAEATKLAWQDPEIKRMKAAYDVIKKSREAKKPAKKPGKK